MMQADSAIVLRNRLDSAGGKQRHVWNNRELEISGAAKAEAPLNRRATMQRE
jgi:hypothetical protein